MDIAASNIINTALRKLGAIAAGDFPAANETADALLDLNGMLDTFDSDRLMIPNLVPNTYTLTIDKQAYTIGPSSADFIATRPEAIEAANLIDLSNASQPVRTPIRIIDADEWAAISVLSTPSTIPEALYYDGATGTGTIRLWGVPAAANQLELWTWQQFTSFPNAAAVLIFPPGYFELLWSHLAMRISSDYGIPVPDSVAAIAAESRRKVESRNAVVPLMAVDTQLRRMSSNTRTSWNWQANR